MSFATFNASGNCPVEILFKISIALDIKFMHSLSAVGTMFMRTKPVLGYMYIECSFISCCSHCPLANLISEQFALLLLP